MTDSLTNMIKLLRRRSHDCPKQKGAEQAMGGAGKPGVALQIQNVNIWYNNFHAVKNVSLEIPDKGIVALIGASGCGKSTLLRSINRMNDLIQDCVLRTEGKILYHGQDIHAADIDPVELRTQIGMVFQKPNPFPMSIYDNIAYGLRLNRKFSGKGGKTELDDIIERNLRLADLWDESDDVRYSDAKHLDKRPIKDRLHESALTLSGGQQQRLCIARTLAVEPKFLLLDEPCSSLDPVSTSKVETTIATLAETRPLLIVTHNMEQARRIGDLVAHFDNSEYPDFPELDYSSSLITCGSREEIFLRGAKDIRTSEYINGRIPKKGSVLQI